MASTSCFRCSGSSKVWQAESTIHPRKSLHICQLPSPFTIFFRDTASLWGSSFRGCTRMASMTWKRWPLRRSHLILRAQGMRAVVVIEVGTARRGAGGREMLVACN